jgi:hypothetical protein
VLDYVPGRSASTKPFGIDYSHNVTIRNCEFDGHLSGGYGSGIGLRGMRSSQITVETSPSSCAARASSMSPVSWCAATTCG